VPDAAPTAVIAVAMHCAHMRCAVWHARPGLLGRATRADAT
jgi:hypothetical protein